MTTLLIAASRKQKEHLCKYVFVGINNQKGKTFTNKDDILQVMEKTVGGPLVQRMVSAFDLAILEKKLENNPWVRDAELYFDSKDDLHVFIEERTPVARIFTTKGASFYIDSSGFRMPLLATLPVRVPVVTGFPNKRKWNAADSSLLNEIKIVAEFINNDPFWNAQVGQIDITATRKLELIPVVGDHLIKLGTAKDVEAKLKKLFVFYKQVLSKAGFNKYAAIDIQYEGQVVAVKRGPVSEIDSIQLKKNIEALVSRASLQNIENDMLPADMVAAMKNDSTVSKAIMQNKSVSTKTNPIPLQATVNTHPTKTGTQPNENPERNSPKAVMPKSGNE